MNESLSHSQMKAVHPEFFKAPVGGRRPTADLGDLENAQIVRRPKAAPPKQTKTQVIEPGTIVPPRVYGA
jgi:hypothetical protein